MSNRTKHLPRAPKPVVSAEDSAKAAVAAQAKARAERCMKEINATLERHRCRVAAHALIAFDGSTPKLLWDVEPVL